MPPPSAPLAVGLGALRTSVGDSVHLVSTCQDTVFLALALALAVALALSMLSSSGSVEAKKTAFTLLEGILPCFRWLQCCFWLLPIVPLAFDVGRDVGFLEVVTIYGMGPARALLLPVMTDVAQL